MSTSHPHSAVSDAAVTGNGLHRRPCWRHTDLRHDKIRSPQDADDHAEQALSMPAINGGGAEPKKAPAALPGDQTGTWFLPPPSADGRHIPEAR